MKNKLVLITFITVLCIQFSYADPSIENIQKGISLNIEQQYDLALELFEKMKTDYPEHPAGSLFSAAVWQSRMMDFETNKWGKLFYQEIDRSIKLSKKQIARNPQNSHIRFFYASALGYKSFQMARDKKYMPAFQIGRQSIKELKKVIATDSSFYDSYLAIGSYNYWRSNLTKKFSWLPFFKDQRQQGILYLQKAAKMGLFSKWAALSNLAWINIEEKNYDAAINQSNEGLKQFPTSRFFLWPLAEAQFKKEDYEDAIDTFSRILDSIHNETEYNNRYNEILIHWKLAQCHYQLKMITSAKQECQKVIAIEPLKEVGGRARDKKKQAKKLLSEIKAKEAQTLNSSL